MLDSLVISISGSLRFSENVVFQNICLTIGSARWTCLLGPSGIGKSMLLKLLAHIPTNGLFEGEIITNDGLPLDNRVSYMAQTDLLFPWLNVLDNVVLGRRLRGQDIEKSKAKNLIEKVGLAGYEYKKPDTLSGGMRQRVALARTLMENKPVVLLDEPFSALDARSRANMQQLSFQMLTEKAVLLVTHDHVEAARLASTLYLMSDSGLEKCSLPPAKGIRRLNDPVVVETQTQLLMKMNDVGFDEFNN